MTFDGSNTSPGLTSVNGLDRTIIVSGAQARQYYKGMLEFSGMNRTIHVLWTSEMLVGRDPVSDICVQDRRVSRKHCVFQLEYGGAKFVDLMSSNGSKRNGEELKGTIILNDKDEIIIGKACPMKIKTREENGYTKSLSVILAENEFLLTYTDVFIGRDPILSDIVINDIEVDPLHAQIEFLFDVAIITSLIDKPDSLLVDNHHMRSYQLKDSSVIQIGNTKIIWKYR